jgi:hypothetical protein
MVALFSLVTNRPALSMGALALSFLSKVFPVLLLLTFLKRDAAPMTARLEVASFDSLAFGLSAVVQLPQMW